MGNIKPVPGTIKLPKEQKKIIPVQGTIQTPTAVPTKTVIQVPKAVQGKQPYNMVTDPLVSTLKAGVEGVFPITRPLQDIAATTTGNETLQELNPYAGKNTLEKGLAYASDITGQAAQGALLMAPGASLPIKAGQLAVQGSMGMGSKLGMDALMQIPQAKEFLEGAGGKILGDYALPIASTVLNVKGGMSALSMAKPRNDIDSFIQKNPEASKDMFNTLNKVTNTDEAMKKMGFYSAQGNLSKVGDELVTEIQKNITKEGNNFAFTYNRIKNIPVDKNIVKTITDKMDNEMSMLGNAREDMALKRDILKYKKLLTSQKKPTLESVDKLKRDFYKDVSNVKKEFESTNAERVGNEVGRFMIDTIENVVPQTDKIAFQNIKKSFGSMAEARHELNALKNISSEKIMQRINDGDKIEALERLVSPEVINKALKATSRANYPNNYSKTMEDYLTRLQKIDKVNEGLAKQLFNVKELPNYSRISGQTAVKVLGGSGTESTGQAISGINYKGLSDEERKKILAKAKSSMKLKSLEERKK
jgi:hypothetical protein